MKKLLLSILIVGLMALAGSSAFAAASSNASCVGLIASTVAPGGGLSELVREVKREAAAIGVPVGQLVRQAAQIKGQSASACAGMLELPLP